MGRCVVVCVSVFAGAWVGGCVDGWVRGPGGRCFCFAGNFGVDDMSMSKAEAAGAE